MNLAHPIKPLIKKCDNLYAVNGTPIKIFGKSEVKFLDASPIPVIIANDMKHDMILGIDALTMGKANIFLGDSDVKMRWFGKMYKLSEYENSHLHCVAETSGFAEIDDVIDRHKIIFEQTNVNCPTATCKVRCTIPTGDHPPIKQRPYRLPLSKRHIVKEQVAEMLAAGIIRPSDSPWSSPITLVPKKDKTWRFCVDYRKLNAITRKDSYPLPSIRDIFDSFHGASIFTTLDMKTGYMQIPIAEEDIEKSAFVCSEGLFEFTKMSFGLTNAGQIFQRYMNSVLRDYIGKFAFVYIDDIIVYSNSIEEHVRHLDMILQQLKDHGLQLKRSKCTFASPSVQLLGYTVTKHGISPQEEKVSAVKNMLPPQNVSELRSFLGACGYYRSCVQNFAQIVEPLVRLTRKYSQYKWGPEQQMAFDKMKDMLCSDLVLAYPDPSKPYKLFTDASDYAVGAILVQTDQKGVDRVIQYVSSTLKGPQRNYAVIEKEAFAVVYALEKLRPYLFGAEFEIFTDHKPLKALFLKEVKNTRIQRWAVLLAEYGAPIRYIQGKKNIYADMLSRCRLPPEVSTFTTDSFIIPDSEDGDILHHIPLKADKIDEDDLRREQSKEYGKHLKEVPEDMTVYKGLLYSTRRPTLTDAEYPRLLLPSKFRSLVLKNAHHRSGHQAMNKTLSHVRDAYVWEGMRRDVQNEVDKCATCQVNRRVKTRATYSEMPVPSYPGEIIGVDLIGPLNESTNGNRYILTVIDHYTAWAEAYPLPKKTSERVENALFNEYFARHGMPRVLISDQGSEFNAHHLRQKFKTVGIDHRRTTPYHPQTNGRTERFNKTLKSILQRLVNNDSRKWEDQLSSALLAYRNTRHDTTGYTPFFLTYGRRARLPLSLPVDAGQTLEDRMGNLSTALRVTKEMTAKSRAYHRQQINRRATRNDFKVGDTVVVKAEEKLTLTSNTDPQYEIVKLRYPVAHIKHQLSNKERVVNVEKLRIVDPQIVWDQVQPRPIRVTRRAPQPATVLDARQIVMAQNPATPPPADDVSVRDAIQSDDTPAPAPPIGDEPIDIDEPEDIGPMNARQETSQTMGSQPMIVKRPRRFDRQEKRPCKYPLRSRIPRKKPRLESLGFSAAYVIHKYL